MSFLFSKLKSAVQKISLNATSTPSHSPYEHEAVHFNETMINHDMPEGPGREQLKEILGLILPTDVITGPWIAGGAARRLLQGQGLDKGDIDLFFHSFRSWSAFEEDLIKKGYEKVYRTTNATTFDVNGFKVQLIRRRYYSSLKEVLTDFDMTACQVAVNGDKIVGHLTAGEDVKNSTLKYAEHGRRTNNAAVPRGLKYINYGFKPEPGFFVDMIKRGMSCASPYSIFDAAESEFSESFYDSDEMEEMDKVALKEKRENECKDVLMEKFKKWQK